MFYRGWTFTRSWTVLFFSQRTFPRNGVRIVILLACMVPGSSVTNAIRNEILLAAPQTDQLPLDTTKSLQDDEILDGILLDRLPGNLNDKLNDKTGAPTYPVEHLLLDNLNTQDLGEDIHPDKQSDSLQKIGQQMQQVARWISQNQTAKRTLQLQQNILLDLNALIEQARQQKQPSGSGTAQPSAARPRQAVAQPPQPAFSGSPGENPHPQQSSELLTGDHDPNPKINLGDMEYLMKEIWGQLPPRIREQLLHSRTDQFLPQYEQIIADYFRRLAEQAREKNNPR